jgi:branched-subunit amino acid transport protein
VTATWVAVLATGAGCYLLKLAGLWVPARVVDHPTVRRLADLLPAALLAALVVVEACADGTRLVLDARLAGLAAAGIAVWRRAPFLVVVVSAAVTAALVRTLT